MTAARTTIGLWLLVQLLLGGMPADEMPARAAATSAQAASSLPSALWRDAACGPQGGCADFIAERSVAKRVGGKCGDEALPGPRPAAVQPARPATRPSAVQVDAHAGLAFTPYRARGPPACA